MASLIPETLENIKLLENIIYKYFTLFLVFIFSFSILFFANIKKSKNEITNKESEKIDE